SPTTLLTVSLGLTRSFGFDHGGSAADFPNFDPVKDLGMPAYIESNGIKAAPSISVYGGYALEGGNNSIGTQAWTYLKYGQETHHLIGTLSHTMGAHELKFGTEGRLRRVDIFFPGIPAGTYSFDYNTTSQQPWSGGGDAMAGLMIGAGGPGNWGAYEVDYAAATQNWNIGSFVQDNWRVTPNLTLNIGLRYDLDLPRTERANRISWLNLDAPSPLQVPGMPNLKGGLQYANSNNRSPYENNYNGWGPRFGFKQCQRNDRHGKNSLRPAAIQEQMPRHQAGDEQYEARVYSAALRRHFQREPRQSKLSAVAKDRHAGQAEKS